VRRQKEPLMAMDEIHKRRPIDRHSRPFRAALKETNIIVDR
jgi:hypothetical protein